MRVVGLDLSLTATGIATEEGVSTIKVTLPHHPNEPERVRRLIQVAVRVHRACEDADLVLLEGYSFASQNSHAHSLGELGGLVKANLQLRGIAFAVIPPATLKKWATGKGNASKDEVLIAAIRSADRAGELNELDITNNNEADAYFLWQLGIWAVDGKWESLSKVRQKVLESVTWPSIVIGGARDSSSRAQ